MKIAIVRSFPQKFNIISNTYNSQELGLAKALINKGHACDLFFYDNNDNHQVYKLNNGKSINIYYKKAHKLLIFSKFRYFHQFLQGYDIIQCDELFQYQSYLLSRSNKNNLIVYSGTYYSNSNLKFNALTCITNRLFAARYKRHNIPFIAKSVLSEKYIRNYGINNVTTVGVGLDTTNLKNKFERSSTKTLNLLYIGKMEQRRNPLFILDIVYAAKDQQIPINLTFIGKGSKKMTEKFFNKATRLGVLKYINYKEEVSQKEIYKYYLKHDVFILPSNYEIYGMVIMESLYYGIPILTTNNGGSSTLLRESFEDMIIDGYSSKEWLKRIVLLKKKYNKKYEILNNYIVNNYTWDKISEKILDIYYSKIKGDKHD